MTALKAFRLAAYCAVIRLRRSFFSMLLFFAIGLS